MTKIIESVWTVHANESSGTNLNNIKLYFETYI